MAHDFVLINGGTADMISLFRDWTHAAYSAISGRLESLKSQKFSCVLRLDSPAAALSPFNTPFVLNVC